MDDTSIREGLATGELVVVNKKQLDDLVASHREIENTLDWINKREEFSYIAARASEKREARAAEKVVDAIEKLEDFIMEHCDECGWIKMPENSLEYYCNMLKEEARRG